MHIKGPKDFEYGYTEIVSMNDAEKHARMDFGILHLKEGDTFEESQHLERCYLLVYGKIEVTFGEKRAVIERENCFDFNPWVLSVPNDVKVSFKALADTEITVHRTDNDKTFDAKLYAPEETRSENRGAGTMREASTRIVRTTFDYTNAPWSNLVIGEVIGFPGKWSSYPPHNHPQPEIYYYKFNPKNGYGFAELDETVHKTHNNSTVLIVNEETHPQTTAPGYAMWYLWVIRHLDSNPYITPYFIPEHRWVTEPESEKLMWPNEG